MLRSITAVVIVLGLCLSAIATPLAAPAPPRRTAMLVVLLVVDQMRADYVERFGDHWTGGLRRLMDEGAWFREAAFSHLATVTCVGHASIVTGALPRTVSERGAASARRAAASDSGGDVNSRPADQRKPR